MMLQRGLGLSFRVNKIWDNNKNGCSFRIVLENIGGIPQCVLHN